MSNTHSSDNKYPGFLEMDVKPSTPEEALFHVIPVPYEKSVSYGHGTAEGPSGILIASQQLETFDGQSVPSDRGIITYPPVSCEGTHEEALLRIKEAVAKVLKLGKMPVVLGGEHTVTVGVLQAYVESGRKFGVVQFDAHADLKDTYEDSPYSHACAMKRAYDMGIPVFQVGIRSLTYEEALFRKQHNIKSLDADVLAHDGIPAPLLPDDFPEDVFITVDIDALDSSIMPATGTPEPGGLTWYQLMDALESIISERNVIGFDLVELAPLPGFHAPDFAAARLLYNMMGMVDRNIDNPA